MSSAAQAFGFSLRFFFFSRKSKSKTVTANKAREVCGQCRDHVLSLYPPSVLTLPLFVIELKRQVVDTTTCTTTAGRKNDCIRKTIYSVAR